jgi:hypothetical protein
VGVTFYDQRNTEIYNALDRRAWYLEEQLKLPPNIMGEEGKAPQQYGGQFHERPARSDSSRYLFGVFEPAYDTALAVIYGTALGAWFYPLVSAFLGRIELPSTVRLVISLMVVGVIVGFFVWVLLRAEPGPYRCIILLRRSSNNPSAYRHE